MAKREPHPAEERPNRYPARCAECGHRVEAGEGFTSKVMGTTRQWRTVHAPGQCPVAHGDNDHPFSSEAFQP